MHRVPFTVTSRWFEGSCDIHTYELDVYQRKKGRDLFDLATGLTKSSVDAGRIVAAFSAYMDQQGTVCLAPSSSKISPLNFARPQFVADLRPCWLQGSHGTCTTPPKQCRRAL